MTVRNLPLRQVSAFVPIAMSLLALTLVMGRIVFVGTAPERDEGAIAHLWQLLLAVQVPIIAFFLIRFFPQQPKQTLVMLALQGLAIVAACTPVFLLHW